MATDVLFFLDSEAAFGSESATRGGSFWTRIRLGKAEVFGAKMSETNGNRRPFFF